MKLIYTLLAFLFFCIAAHAQGSKDYAVQITATTQVSPPSIRLQWNKIPFGTPVYYIYKKAKTSTSWGLVYATVSTGDTFYVDNSVIVDSVYEYQITASGTGLAVSNPSGYILAGIKAPAIHNRGALVLLVDSTFTDSCSTELKTLMTDISGDGWQVIRHDLGRTMKDTAVKNRIKADYTNIPNVKAVLILGHIAVPHSGAINPDGHPDHVGAWPADVFYGNMAGSWTDVSVSTTVSSNPLNYNVPGDGRWDQDYQAGYNELQVSRVDFFDMPAFPSSEVTKMRRYLNKSHTYKMDSLNVRHRALISDNFGAFSGEAFAANAWRNFAPMVTRDSINATLPYITTLGDSSYQWAYACGGGTYTSAGGVGNTTNFASAGACHAIFTMMFGSYFGDWDYQNNFLRAPLCADTPALTCAWAGRPNWFLHHMALGEHIGYGALLTQNNNALPIYTPPNYGVGMVHVALMGDLTLRTDYIKKPANLNATPVPAHGATLTWTASPGAGVIGYYVYRTDSMWGYYKKISPMLTGTTFNDTVGTDGLKYYMVRPVKLQSTPSGAYYNLGIGITDTATIDFPAVPPAGITDIHTPLDINIFPNPATQNLRVNINAAAPCTAHMYIVSITGEVLYPITKELSAGQNAYSLDVSTLPAGVYTLCVNTGDGVVVRKWVKM